MMKRNFSKIIILVLFLSFITLTGLRCTIFSQKAAERIKPIVLNWWRVADSADTTTELISAFNAQYSHVKINYQQFRPEEYEQALLEAWAEDRGPDIFSIPNTLLGKYETKILPMPPKITIGKQVLTGTIKKDYKIVVETKQAPTLRDLKNNFVGTVVEDTYKDDKIWGLPMALDTLALYYNRDLLNQARLVEAPKTWEDLVSDMKLLTILDSKGKIVQSGAALGTANNVDHAVGILSALMLQNGTMMTRDNKVSFNLPSNDDPTYFPGEEAIRFYTDFSNPGKEVYAWNKDMPSSLDAFLQGKAAFYFGYASDLLKIRSMAPTLNFDVSKMPQIGGSLKEANYANYYIETVSKKTKYMNEAWAFVMFATDAKNVKSYLDRAKRLTAQRSLIKGQLADFDLGAFANTVLTAESWYHGENWPAAEKAIKDMINDVANNNRTIKEAIAYYMQIINQTY
ncbi:MAG: extracellular solute-binding protein [Patescibacteria group bacterium]|nr:extracellular solute-binding protein [Patescibacteria group bacterium]MDD5121146.1 extracellular solute-binding protein [Patescibacteria group bacterium]MDD5221661.1 extracellular solute-binding protein [Patescibacteria group bacterium]MDD5395935.1 extracellular solute-binding protein [Patescibacteria group bacterium]